MLVFDYLWEKVEEERYHQQPDVHAIDIGIRCDYYLVVTDVFDAFLDVEGGLQEVELLVFIDHFFGESVTVERLAPQTEHSLCIDVAALGDAAARRVTLRDEYRSLRLALVVGIEMDVAVAELAVVEVHLFGALTGYLLYARHRLAVALVVKDFFEQRLRGVGVFVEVVVELLADEIEHEVADAFAVGLPEPADPA